MAEVPGGNLFSVEVKFRPLIGVRGLCQQKTREHVSLNSPIFPDDLHLFAESYCIEWKKGQFLVNLCVTTKSSASGNREIDGTSLNVKVMKTFSLANTG